MDKNVGNTIKYMAKLLVQILSTTSIFAGIVVLIIAAKNGSGRLVGTGLVFLILVPLLVWISGLFSYAFGELVDCVSDIREQLKEKMPQCPNDANK